MSFISHEFTSNMSSVLGYQFPVTARLAPRAHDFLIKNAWIGAGKPGMTKRTGP